MTALRHPNIKPDLVIEVAPDDVAAHVAAGWRLEATPLPAPDPDPDGDPVEAPTPERPRRARRAASDSPKEIAT